MPPLPVDQARSRTLVDTLDLVGDASHLMPPYGGLGGTTGVADAHNLAWKLAAVCAGEAGDDLLDTYESERQTLAEYTVKKVEPGHQRPEVAAR